MINKEITKYPDGGWCQQDYVNGKLHGLWSVYFPDGSKNWEREYINDRQEGYQRDWDKNGNLIEEQWYHLNELHGIWKKWDKDGVETIIGEFFYGYPKEQFDKINNKEFLDCIKPYFLYDEISAEDQINNFLTSVVKPSLTILQSKQLNIDLRKPQSFWAHVNVLGEGESWPYYQGNPLSPILQFCCADIPIDCYLKDKFSYITLFAVPDNVCLELGSDIVIRTYKKQESIKIIDPPLVEKVMEPALVEFSESINWYPDEDDFPPTILSYIEDNYKTHFCLEQDKKLNSRFGGWPGWLQSGRLADKDSFAFQIDSLDFECWDCGDCTIHYFFMDEKDGSFSWEQEMC